MNFTHPHTGILAYLDDVLAHYANAHTRLSYQKSVTAFRAYLHNADIPFEEVTPELAEDWHQALILEGHEHQYIQGHGKHLRALWRRAVKSGLATGDPFAWGTNVSQPTGRSLKSPKGRTDALLVLRKLYALEQTDMSPMGRTRDLLLIAVLLGGLTYADLYALRPADYADGRLRLTVDGRERSIPVSPLADTLIQRNRSAQAEYLLACYQQVMTEEQASRQWEVRAEALLSLVTSLKITPPSELSNILTESALRDTDTPLQLVRSALVRIPSASALKALEVRPQAQRNIDAAYRALSDAVTDTTRRWYALRMRVDYARLEHHLTVNGLATADYDPYYPMDILVQRTGKRIEQIKSPVLKRILFVHATDAVILRLADVVRPKGLLYRSTAGSRRPYAVIPQRSMNEFKRIISHGTDFDENEYAMNNDLPPQTLVTLTGDTLTGKDALIIRPIGTKKYLVQVLDTQFTMTYEVPKSFIRRKRNPS